MRLISATRTVTLEPMCEPARGESVLSRGGGAALVVEDMAAAWVVVAGALLLDDDPPPQALTTSATPSATIEYTTLPDRTLDMTP